jgi:hypothetical protein
MKPVEKIKNGFITGFFNGGTPFSAKDIKHKKGHNPLRKKAEQLLECRNFEDEDIIDSICYFSGGLFGIVIAPVDAIITFYGDIKESFKLK